MKPKRRLNDAGVVPIALLLLFGYLVCASPQTLLAQGSANNKSQDSRTFGGRGSARKTEGRQPPKAPGPLTSSALQGIVAQLGKTAPGATYVKLTPSQPAVTNRGALVFVDADIVETGESYAYYEIHFERNPRQGHMMLWLDSAAKRSYLIDCAVSGLTIQTDPKAAGGISGVGSAFEVLGPDGTSQTIKFAGTGGQHLVFPLNTTTAGWYPFRITGVGIFWAIYSCEVKSL
ncbi:MAG TPA: hypothetical protein VGQ39_12465 [Pyrinomonadaceae bacterium]|jgi:hypothetical protein|nr:hypothetical protein [Pyrinomonadaceae bacterium]